MTIHKCFLCPFKRQNSMLCFIEFRFLGIPVKSLCRERDILRATYQYIPNTCAYVEFPFSDMPVFLAMQWSIALSFAFYRGREDIYEKSSALTILFEYWEKAARLKCFLRPILRLSTHLYVYEEIRTYC